MERGNYGNGLHHSWKIIICFCFCLQYFLLAALEDSFSFICSKCALFLASEAAPGLALPGFREEAQTDPLYTPRHSKACPWPPISAITFLPDGRILSSTFLFVNTQ